MNLCVYRADVCVVLLAGGAARRLPRKLERRIAGVPLLLQVRRNVDGPWPVYVCTAGRLPAALVARLDCLVLRDRTPGAGPLCALADACAALTQPRVFAVAGDMPHVGAAVLHLLIGAFHEGDEAVVPEHDGVIEPLVALYDRAALLREASVLLREGERAMHCAVERLRTRRIRCDGAVFVNVNTPEDLRAVRATSR